MVALLATGKMIIGSAGWNYDNISYIDAEYLYKDKPFPANKKDFLEDYKKFAAQCQDKYGIDMSLEDFVNCLKYIKSVDLNSSYVEDKTSLVINLMGAYDSITDKTISFSEFILNLLDGIEYKNLSPNQNQIAIRARNVDPFGLGAPRANAGSNDEVREPRTLQVTAHSDSDSDFDDEEDREVSVPSAVPLNPEAQEEFPEDEEEF